MSALQFKRAARQGVAAVEMAVCLPVLVLLTLASIEACTMIFVQQTLETTAYEAARFAVSPTAVAADGIVRGQQVIDDRGLVDAQINVDPSTPQRGDNVTATVTAPFDSNRMFPQFFFGNQLLSADVTMRKE